MEPLNLKVNPAAQFRMQPFRFVLDEILRPLKVLSDQFVSEGVLVSDNSCDFASPLVIVNKKWGYQNGCGLSRGKSANGNDC